MPYVYILLTRTHTILSNVIHAATADEFTHASISLDPTLTTLYSFARKYNAVPYPAGLVEESLDRGIFLKKNRSSCVLYRAKVGEHNFQEARQNLLEMYCEKQKYKFSMLGLVLCKMEISYEREHHYFCSQFVGKIMEDANVADLPKPSTLMRPDDFKSVENFHEIYRGDIAGLALYMTRQRSSSLSHVSHLPLLQPI